MKSSLELIRLSAICLTLGLLTACADSNHKIKLVATPVCSASTGCNTVGTFDLPTPIDVKSWIAGKTCWTWQKQNNGGQPLCQKWVFIDALPGARTRIQLNESLDCQNWPPSQQMNFGFDTLGNVTDEDGKVSNMENILDHFVISNQKTQILKQKKLQNIKAGDKGYHVYSMANNTNEQFIEQADAEPELNGVLFKSKDWKLIDFGQCTLAPTASPAPPPANPDDISDVDPAS